MKTLARILISILGYQFVKQDLRKAPYQNYVCGTRTNMVARPIENNGGL